MKPVIAGAVFDLDGTLLDSMGIWQSLGRDYLKSLGVIAPESLDEKLQSLSLEQAAVYMKDEYHLEQSVSQIVEGIAQLIADFYQTEASLKPGVQEFLVRLKEAGIPMCVLTATAQELAEAALFRTGVLPYFEAVLSCTSAKESKNQPGAFKTACQLLKTAPENTLVFEDALYALRAAEQAGCQTVGIYDRFEPQPEALRETADLWLPDWQKNEALVKRLKEGKQK